MRLSISWWGWESNAGISGSVPWAPACQLTVPVPHCHLVLSRLAGSLSWGQYEPRTLESGMWRPTQHPALGARVALRPRQLGKSLHSGQWWLCLAFKIKICEVLVPFLY